MITVTSKNRGAAKKLLTLLGHPAAAVRQWTLNTLSHQINVAVNQDMITEFGAKHALSIEPEKRDSEVVPEDAREGQDGQDGDENDNNKDYDAENESEGESESENDSDAEGEGEGEGENESEDEGDSEGEGDSEEEGEEEGEGDSESEDESESESESEEDDNEENDEENNEENDEENDDNENESEDDNEDDDEEIEHDMLGVVLKYIKAGLNVALVGPAGSGKSYIARQVARKLNLDFYVNGAMLSKYDLIGYCDASGKYHSTPAYDALTSGGVHCFDELDASAPDAVVSFNGMTDDQPFFTFPNGQQEKHKDYVAIACMNTYGKGATADYVGRYKQDEAAMSRFVKVYIDCAPAVEKKCGKADIVARVQAVRNACATLCIRHIVSTRMILQADAARKVKVTKAEIDRDIIFAGLDESAITQIKAQMRKDKAAAKGA